MEHCKYKEHISKEEVQAIATTATYQGQIIVVDTIHKVAPAIKYLSKFPVVGFDTETKPVYVKGQFNNVALIQLATDERAYLFRTCKLGMPARLKAYLEDPQFLKIGISLKDDISNLKKMVELNAQGMVELHKLCQPYGIYELSLRNIYAIMFNERIVKKETQSNWERDPLTSKQLHYAALDAYACLRIYNTLQACPMPPLSKFGEFKQSK